ncbi:Mediator of RNA polymerase II transcription subunit 6 [Lachnellula cervina]|uniref:Mediator of RNA polymerase II transcription subunit 6 n=1 Tax=Lachnellula cervina TaxID=1316786 RepID=A0A7D8UQE5_9HELO|nr:Mediator of RNA polymerase II transcription subunit 6 [Lachnellula cervina]
MASQEPPLDEMQWHSQQMAINMLGIHSNSVLFYFAESPFFDKTSNNAVLYSQALYNQAMLPVIQTREAFEGRLKTMSGLEFMVAQEPADPVNGTGVWVIRKQTRRKKQNEEDEIVLHSTYFVMGENIYMAPAVADVLASRTLSILTSLNKFFSTAATLPSFTPALGTTYLPPPSTSRLKPTESQGALSQTSKENTPLPDSLTSKKAPLPSTNNSTFLSSRLLEESLNITLKYGEEYMDENPITGEPGAFHLTTTGRVEKDKLAVPVVSKGGIGSKTGTPAPPSSLKTTGIEVKKEGLKGEKTPTKSPGVKGPKRRKSKGVNSAGGVTPTT